MWNVIRSSFVRSGRPILCAVAGLLPVVWIVEAREATPTPGQSIAGEGVYTLQQAERGRAIYERECTTCHGVDMQGGETAASLTGTLFRDYWGKQTAGALFDTIQQTMPEDDPGRLLDQPVVDVMALLLMANGFPAGDRELVSDWDALEEIRLVMEREQP